MINRKIERLAPNTPEINAFHFVCPFERESEARNVLGGMYGVTLYTESKPVSYVTFPSRVLLEGNLVGGTCYPSMTEEIENQLRERRIAGYDPTRSIHILTRRELEAAYGTIPGFRKWLKRR